MKRQATECEKIFRKPVFNKELVSRIYEEISKSRVKKPNNPIKKWANDLDTSLRKMIGIISHVGNANKATVNYHYTPFRMAKIVRTDHTES